jgi:alkylresorcinol/alkylpyrone synthase
MRLGVAARLTVWGELKQTCLLAVERATRRGTFSAVQERMQVSARAERVHASHPSIVAVSTALPRHHYRQQELAAATRALCPELANEPKRIERFFQRVHVRERYLALPLEAYAQLGGMRARSEAWVATALELGERAVRSLLEQAEIDPSEVGMMMSTTVTGMAVPSIEARLMNRIPFSPGLKRVPLFGLGCLAGTAGIARVSEYLRAYPRETAILLSVELCSLTLQPNDPSTANVVASGLFGDGAAAVLVAGAEHPLSEAASPRVLDGRSRFFPNTERVMGWDVVDSGFKVVLGPEVPELARREVPALVDGLLSPHGLSRSDVEWWIAHPGGPAVTSAMCEGLGLPAERFALSRKSLAEVGNLSSASVLFVLEEVCTSQRPRRGSYGVMLSMGPAFCAEAVLLRW